MHLNVKKQLDHKKGYITEEGVTNAVISSTSSKLAPIISTAAQPSSSSSSSSSKTSIISHESRPLGPLSSAKAKARHRRSRSALGLLENHKSSASRISRASKLRATPQIRTMSADRAEPVTPKIAPNAPVSVLRYPRLGETVISLSGSPVVTQG